MNEPNTLQFPSSFFFGVADADLQVIGEKHTISQEQSAPTMWSDFSQRQGKEGPEEGIDRYHQWTQDIEIMKRMGIKHYRTSISMSRILTPHGQPNTKAIQWYAAYFKTLKAAGIAIYATLYHWELPLYLHEQGGWKDPATVDVFVKHVQTVVNTLGEYIDQYFILNEPWCASLLSYHLGIHAPGEKTLAGGLLAAHHMLVAQGRAFQAIQTIAPTALIGTVVNTETAYAFSSNPKDIQAARYADGYFNRWFLDPLFVGRYPSDMVELYGPAMPKVTAEDMKTIQIGAKLHALGINYYCGRINKWDEQNELHFSPYLDPQGPTNDLGWPICIPPHYPEGFYDMLTQVWYSYKDHGLKRIYITENGMALQTDWDGESESINDQRRIDYYQTHIGQVHTAICRGIPIEGYFAWTLMDNFEWAESYRPQSTFGMIHVDRKTMKRIWKQSAKWYSHLIQTKTL